ncbi:hypothetical protein KP509_05G098500 [Ceratopteris richardii]|uniref:Uncharacterized protein n=1 Tax=Ceratopteris richardii TaxID=49495 RepID=A0A8T2UPD7_CERRI|nr:hypothetical protein KP509_05G098500 [Ceratopteris richardii]
MAPSPSAHGSSGGGRSWLANPAPLGLFGFALTTFVISSYNAGIFGVSASDPINVVVVLGIFYGGLAQAAAGILEFIYGDTFAATAFTSYGAFWLSYAALSIPWFGVSEGYSSVLGDTPHADYVYSRAIAIYLLAWTIFTFIMTLGSTRISIALCSLFCLVAITFTLLTVGEFGPYLGAHRAAGFIGIITAVVAWYNALAELFESQEKPLLRLPLGKISQGAAVDDESRHSNRYAASM